MSVGMWLPCQLARKGCFVYLGSRDKEKGNEAVNKLNAEGLNADCIEIDVTNPVQPLSSHLKARVPNPFHSPMD